MSNVVRNSVKRSIAPIVVFAAILGLAIEAHAQVGHPTGSSPYTPLQAKRVLSLGVGYLAGQAGTAGVGPTDGPLAAARFNLNLTGPIDIDVNASVANLNRGIINPNSAPADSILETVKQTVTMLDAGIILLLTGQKTWNRMVPYLGLSLGVAFGGSVPEDTLSGFTFKTQFQIAPSLGVRWYPSDRLMFRLDFRDVIWRLSYPPSFFERPADDPTSPPVLNPNTQNNTDWTHHPTLVFTIGYVMGF
jgi:hypothetical protein